MGKKNKMLPMTGNSRQFFDSLELNDLTFMDYRRRFMKIALSMFEWVNLPETMDARWLEYCLYLYGECALFKDNEYGFINTQCNASGKINIYGLPVILNCYSFGLQRKRLLYTGLETIPNRPEIDKLKENQAILVMNDWQRTPTAPTMDLFAYRLYECERTVDVNIKNMKLPLIIRTTEKLKHSFEQLYNKIDGNQPALMVDKGTFDEDNIKILNTNVEFIADKVMLYKKQIWNEALTFLGINNILEDKKERLITDETSANNELINLNLQSYLAPRQKACEQFNKFYNLSDDKKISVRVRSDLKNIIKQAMSVVSDFEDIEDVKNIEVKEEKENGNIYNKT